MRPSFPARPRTQHNIPRYPRLALGVALGVVATVGCSGPAQLAGAPAETHQEATPQPDTTAPDAGPNAPQPQPDQPDPKETLQPPGAPPAAFDET